MATIDHGSPSQFVGQPWSSWADKVVGTDNKDAPSGRGDEETDGSLEVQDEDADREQDREQVMKLRIEDANVFGICPTQDEFYLVVCEQCKQVVKPQALERHMELRHGKPPDKPPDITREMEMHSPQILIPTTLRAPLDKSRLPSQYENSPEVDSELSHTHSMHPLSIRPPASQTNQELTFDTVLTKQLPGHLAQRQESPINYTTTASERDRQNASPTGLIQLNSPLGSQESISSLVSTTLPVVKVEKMSPQQTCDSAIQSFGISPTSLASIQQTTIELASAPGRSIQCAPNTLPQQSQTLLQTAKPVQPAMVQLAPVPAGMMQTVKPALVQPPPIQPAPAHTSLLKLAPAHPVPTKKSKKLSPKKNILCKDREYDVNKHCGVWVEADQRQCTRSLTCKTHALSLRRAVKGRRKPFDELLAEHKARSQALAASNNPSLIKKPVPPTPTSGLPSNLATQGNSAARPTTPKVVPPRPNTPKATTPKALTPKLLTPRTQTASLHVKTEPGVKPQVMFQKIMPVPGPVKTFNLNSVLPTKKPHSSLPQRVTSPTPEVPSPQSRPSLPEAAGSGSGSGSWSSGHVKSGLAEKGAETKDKSDFSCSHHHPRPVAMCSYGARQVGKGLYAFNRRLDHLRSTMAALVEKHTSRPPPLKKMCLSNEPLEDVAMDTSPPSDAPNLQMNNSASSHSAASTSAFSFSSISLFDTIPSGSKIPAALCGNSSSNGADSVSRVKSVPNAVQNNFSKGAAKKLSKVASKTPGKSSDGKGLSSMQHPVKNSKARRKSGSSGGGGGGKSNASASVSVAQNLFSVSSASPVTLTPASSAYSIVTNSGLQLGGGVVGLDPATLSGQELSDSLLKNLRFVVTNIDPNVNGGAAATANSATPQASSNFTVPILNATIGNALGNTPVLLGNLGALALPYDRKLNVKSRTKSASSGKSTVERQGRRLSGGNTVTGLQNIAIVNQPFVECTSQETMSVGGGGGGVGGGGSETGFTVNMCQSLQSPQSNAPSPQLRPNSASPQLSSPIPNGIIPSPTNITFKPYPGTVIATSTVASANHVQRGMSPSRTSTPSPGTGSTEASPNISTHILPGSFTTSGKLSLVSPKGSSHNLPKSTLNQKHSHPHLHHRSIAQLTSQQQLQQQQQQQQQQALQFHQLQLTPQQISNLVAMDAQGKPMPLSSALIPGLFQSIPTQPVNQGAIQGGLTLAPAVAADQGGKVLSQSAVLPQGAIALHLQQPGSGQPISLQGGDQSQIGMSQEEDNRQELKMQH